MAGAVDLVEPLADLSPDPAFSEEPDFSLDPEPESLVDDPLADPLTDPLVELFDLPADSRLSVR